MDAALFDGDFYVSPPPDESRPACNLVFVQSRDGNTGASNPSSLGGGETDKHLIYEGLSRVAADAVLAGAETIRAREHRLVGLASRARAPSRVARTTRGIRFRSSRRGAASTSNAG